MRETLIDIRNKIVSGAYKNEEHVRLAIVARILLQLGWNIWDPAEVNCEFNPVPDEDKTRVDIALFSNPRVPDVFIETKSMGKIRNSLAEIETQLRNYNRDNTALFSVITDGRVWRFYLSRAGGKFSEKCFKVIDLQGDDLDDIQTSFSKFLQKDEIIGGSAEDEAVGYLRLNEKQRTMGDVLPQAKKASMEPPYPRVPNALVSLLAEKGFQVSVDEAEKLMIEVASKKEPKELRIEPRSSQPAHHSMEQWPVPEKRLLRPESPPSLSFTKVIGARFGSQSANNWNNLLALAIKTAMHNHIDINGLQALSVPVKVGQINTDGYAPLPGTNNSFQNVGANRAWLLTLTLAKKLNIEVEVSLRWREKENAAFPGEVGVLQWKP